jgi:hypothetical protein
VSCPAKKSLEFEEYLADVTDPRRCEGTYPLINILFIAGCAVICGADDFLAIGEFGRSKRKFLEKFLDLSAGFPSHDRFNAIFRAIKRAEFEKCLLNWIVALHEVMDGQVVAIDGKSQLPTLCRRWCHDSPSRAPGPGFDAEQVPVP